MLELSQISLNKKEKKEIFENNLEKDDNWEDNLKLIPKENGNIKSQKYNNNDNIIIKENCYKKKLKCLFKIIVIILFAYSYYYYSLSLEGCFLGEDICSSYTKWIFEKIRQELYSCIIMAILVQLMIIRLISALHLIHIFIYFFVLFLKDHGLNFDYHGYFNCVFYFIILGILTVLILPFNLTVYCVIKKKKKKILILIIYLIIFTIFISTYLIVRISSRCNNWEKGLNNTYIENNEAKYGCQITIPKNCYYKVFNKIQDLTKLKKKNCKTFKISESKQNLIKKSTSSFINDKVNKIGYPLTNKDAQCFLDFIEPNNLVRKYFLNNLVDMENEKILNEYFKNKTPEIEIDFSNGPGEMIINVEYNKTLSEERKLLEKNSNPYSNNILLLYLDSVSRNNALRELKKTMNFFENFISYKGGFNKKYPSENFHSFQFFKYYSFIGYTATNYPFIFYGQKKENINITLITKYLKENGFITSNAHDVCKVDNTRIHHNLTKEEIYDHQFLLCDPNNEHFSRTEIRCLYGKQNIEYLFEYTDQFWRKYKDNRKYSAIITNHGHEGTLKVIKYSDDIIYNFLNNLYNDNLLKDSIIFLVSDHGVSMPSIYYLNDFYKIEAHLPMLYIIVNDRKNISYEEQYKYLHENQQTFITAFDIYNTFGHLILGDKYIDIKNKTNSHDTIKSEYGISLFDKINPKIRFPKLYANISEISYESCK